MTSPLVKSENPVLASPLDNTEFAVLSSLAMIMPGQFTVKMTICLIK
jgi:hypothetical protein